MDGTFVVCPSLFYHWFTIHGFNGKLVMPLVFCLLPNKAPTIYAKMFEAIKDLKCDFKPSITMTDFEIGIGNAFNIIFGQTGPLEPKHLETNSRRRPSSQL